MLLADIGNTCTKLRGSDGAVRLATDPSDVAGHAVCAVSSAPGRLALLEQQTCVRLVGRDIPLPDLGQYPECGADRVLSGVGALAHTERSVVVVDAGTATTVTAWHYQPAAPWAGRFVGGVIAPGAAACLAGLKARAPHLPVPDQPEALSALSHSTAAAIANALGFGYPGLVKAVVDQVCRESGIEEVVLTGGAATTCGLTEVVTLPDLVLDGLSVVVARLPGAIEAQTPPA